MMKTMWCLIVSVLWLTACASIEPSSKDAAAPNEPVKKEALKNENAKNDTASEEKSDDAEKASEAAKKKPVKPSGNEPPFAKVIEDAKEFDGFLKLYRKDDKVWIELTPEDFDRLFYLKSNLDRGIGEKRFFGGMMTYPAGVQGVVQFRKVGRTVQMLEKNMGYTAAPESPEARAVARSFSDSLLSSAPLASQPHPERNSVLVEANALFVNDMPAAASALEQSYRQGYSFDARNSYLADAKASADLLTFDVNAHYALSRIVMPPMLGHPSGEDLMPPIVVPSLPSTLPDVRSLFLGFHYSLAPLPTTPMKTRVADERVGYFVTEQLDFTDNNARLPIVRLINRWRLEKKDPDAALSDPVTPITFWLDRTIPLRYREPIREGALEWNKAFERIGFKDVIRVEIEPDDATFSTSDLGKPSIRWLTTAKASFGGIGPSVVDPRTGEILDADIGLDASQVRAVASIFSEAIGGASANETNTEIFLGRKALSDEACMIGATAMQETQFGLSLLALRGDVVPEDAATQRFVFDYLKSVTMHEVGHTLGLRHNFHASTTYSDAQLSDKAFTETHGLGGSIMEYLPWNLALAGKPQGAYQMTTLGPYDYWAIEYGYSVWPSSDEAAALAKIAQRANNNPTLAYATDEDAAPSALDPEVNTNDLGSDPLAYAQKRMALSKELWSRSEAMTLPEGTRYALLRRNFTRGMLGAEQAVTFAVRYVGGARLQPARAGDTVDPLTPITAAKQRQALQFLTQEVLSANSIAFSPVFLRHLAASAFDKQNAETLGAPTVTTDVAVDQLVLSLHKKALNPLLSERTAQRLLNNMAKTATGEDALTLGELHATLRKAIWSELKGSGDIPLMRRNLQREYARRIAAPLLTVSPTYPADARALLRLEAEQLKTDIEKRQARARHQAQEKVSPETVAHLEEMRVLLTQALQAPMIRTTP